MMGTTPIFYLSLNDMALPQGSRFCGACIVEAQDEVAAIAVAVGSGFVPDGDACIHSIRLPDEISVPTAYMNRLLSKADIIEFDRAIGGTGEAVDSYGNRAR